MTLSQLMTEIDSLIAQTPYTRAEVALLWEAEDEDNCLPESILTLAAAYEYLNRVGKTEADYLRGKYERLLGELKERYSERISEFRS